MWISKPNKCFSNFSDDFRYSSIDNVTLVLNCEYPRVPDKIPVLKVINRNLTEEEVLTIAKELFNFTGEVIPRPRGEPEILALEVTDGLHHLVLFNCGAVEYSEEYGGGYQGGPGNVPSPSRCREIANNFLNKVINYGLAPKNSLIKVEYYCDQVGMTTSTDTAEYIESWAVNYKVLFNNTPLVRDIGYLEVSIYVGPNGRIVDFYGDWREVELGEFVKTTISPEKAFKSLTTNYQLKSKPSKIIISNMYLSWKAELPHKKQTQLLPVYVFEGVAIFDNGEKLNYVRSLAATNLTDDEIRGSEQTLNFENLTRFLSSLQWFLYTRDNWFCFSKDILQFFLFSYHSHCFLKWL